jgi:drug/metabolite transporter (DMT)-like permease
VLALVIAFGGLLNLFYQGLSNSRSSLLGGTGVLLAVTLSSWSVVYAKSRLREVDSVVATGMQLLFGAVGLGWATWALESHRRAVWTQSAVLAMAFLIVFGSCAAFVIYYWLLKRMQPYQLSTTSLIVPVVAVLEGGLIWGEPIPFSMVLAIVVVLGAVGSVVLTRNEPEVNNDEKGRVLMVEGHGE